MKLFVKDNMEAKEKVVIIASAELSILGPVENTNRTNRLETYLLEHKIPHKKALGSYKGLTEESFVIVPRSPADSAKVLTQAKYVYEQESILARKVTGEVGLVLLNVPPGDDSWVELGDELRCVPGKVAELHDGWTKVDGRFYVVV